MKLNKLRHVIEVARLGSFSRAARAQHVTQSAVTKNVAEIEAMVGFAVFHRTSRGAVLTEAGRDFVDRASRIVADSERFFEDYQAPLDPFESRLRIGICPPSLEELLAVPVAELVSRHRKLMVDLTATSADRGLQMLRRGDVDLAFAPSAVFTGWTEFTLQKLRPLQARAFVRKEHPLARRKDLEPEDLVEFAFVSPGLAEPHADLLRDLYRRHGRDPKRMFHIVDNLAIVRRIVSLTDAIAVASVAFTETERFRERFEVLQLPLFAEMPLCCAHARRWAPTTPAQEFMHLLEASIGSA